MARGMRVRPGTVRVLLAVVLVAAGLTLGGTAVANAASSPGHSPVPVFSSANGVSCPRPSHCLAVGAYNANDVVRALSEVWNGVTWSVIPTAGVPGAASSALNAVSCSSPSQCLAVGSYTDSDVNSWAFAERWNGWAWTLVDTARPDGAVATALNGISCATASSCVAVGSATNGDFDQLTLTEFWNGTAWSIVPSPNRAGANSSTLSAVSCTGVSACVAVGGDLNAAFVDVTLVESWNGAHWSVVQSPNPGGPQGSSLNAVSCATASRCVAVGRYANGNGVGRTLAESWNGSTWSVAASLTPSGSPNSALYGVSCPSSTSCLAVGHSYSPSLAAKDETLAEAWNGSSWRYVASPSPSTTSSLYGVSCAEAANCLAVGLFFNSSGDYQTVAQAWHGTTMSIVNQDAVLPGVSCVTVSRCVAVGSALSGSVSRTVAELWNGKAWWVVSTPNPASSQGSYLDAVACVTPNRCVAVGYFYAPDNSRKTLVESWDGTRWSVVPSPNPSGAAYSVLYGVSCTSASQCMAVGSAGGRAFAESWDGSHWTLVATPNPSATAYSELNGIACTAASYCLAVGYETDTVFHADLTFAELWNGSTWSIVGSAAPGKQQAQASVLHAIACTSANDCLATGYRQRTSGTFETLSERWDGHSWDLQASPSPAGSPYSDLGAISCVTSGQCLALGTSFAKPGDFKPLTERWSGTQWSLVASPATAALPSQISYLQGVSCAAVRDCVATGITGNPANLYPSTQRWDGTGWSVLARRD